MDKQVKTDQGPNVIALPPQIYAGFMVTAFILEYIRPLGKIDPTVRWWGGVLICLIGSGVMTVAIQAFAKAKTPLEPNRATETLVAVGIYRYSRNPIYIGLTGIYLGIAVCLSNVWMMLFLLPLHVLLHFGVIRKEESYLEEKFGDIYLQYKNKTRRWI